MTSNTEQQDLTSSRPRRRGPAKSVARPVQRGTSAAATIYRDLREAILSVHRKPGEPIYEKQIAETYGVSRTPVREAVLKLADEGLVEIFPQSGTFVARIPLGGLPEAITIRRVLEEATVRFAAERASRSQVAKLRANVELQHEKETAGDLDGFHDADEAFHALLAEASGYPGFWTVTQQVKMQVDRYRHLTLPVVGRVAKAIAEHQAILDAIAAGDADRAARALTHHLDDLQVGIDEARRTNPEYFVS